MFGESMLLGWHPTILLEMLVLLPFAIISLLVYSLELEVPNSLVIQKIEQNSSIVQADFPIQTHSMKSP